MMKGKMEGKLCLVTGANAGIGKATADGLLQQGAELILWCRTEEKAASTRQELLQKHPQASIEIVAGDLSSQTAIRAGANKILDRFDRLDVLVNNAGVWNSKRELTEDGIEKVLAVNHLAYFLLSYLLYPIIAKAPNGRIVCVASDSHFQIKGLPVDPQLSNNYHGLRSYAVSKLANVLFTYEFERRKTHQNLSIYAVQPGLVQTDIGLKHSTWLHALAWKVRRQMKGNKSPSEGAATSIYLASEPDVAQQSGLYWDNCQPKKSSPGSYDQEKMEWLWEQSLEWCGIEDYFGESIKA